MRPITIENVAGVGHECVEKPKQCVRSNVYDTPIDLG